MKKKPEPAPQPKPQEIDEWKMRRHMQRLTVSFDSAATTAMNIQCRPPARKP